VYEFCVYFELSFAVNSFFNCARKRYDVMVVCIKQPYISNFSLE